MNKRIRIAIAAATIVGGFTMTSAGSASAGHCVEDGSTPGFSYFGKEGRLKPVVDSEGSPIAGGNTGGPGGNECPANTDSPSERAPGQNKS